MRYIKIVIFIFLLTEISLAYNFDKSDTTKSIKINSIKILGNRTTEEHIILRELDFKVDDIVSQSQLAYNQERVFSLGIFSKVKFDLNKINQNTDLVIRIEESWYIYPFPYLVLRENSLKRSSYGMGVLYKNFRGRNETLWALVTFGYDPTYLLSYYNPVLVQGSNFTFGFELGYTDLDNRNIASEILNGSHFSYNYIYGSFSIGYRLNQFNQISHTSKYEYLNMPETVTELSASGSNIDRIFSMALAYELDNRNLKQFSNDGTYASVILNHKGFGINDILYNVFTADIRKYNMVYGDFAAKWRGLFRSTFGKSIPFYALSLLGDQEYIRGHRFSKREGNNYFLTSLEFNYPIIKATDLQFDLPLLPKSLTAARIGLYANLFFDTGETFNNGETPNIKNLDSGWGFGITLLVLPYNAIRFEYAFNESNESEFIIETGFSF